MTEAEKKKLRMVVDGDVVVVAVALVRGETDLRIGAVNELAVVFVFAADWKASQVDLSVIETATATEAERGASVIAKVAESQARSGQMINLDLPR